jgi:hypothetical protein
MNFDKDFKAAKDAVLGDMQNEEAIKKIVDGAVKKKPRGRYEAGRPELEIDLERVAQLAALGLNITQIYCYLGIGKSTFAKKRRENPKINEAFNRGKSGGIASVADALKKCAEKGDVKAQIFYLKTQAGWKEVQQVEHVVMSHEQRLKELEE